MTATISAEAIAHHPPGFTKEIALPLDDDLDAED
jgi:hypothetical protein